MSLELLQTANCDLPTGHLFYARILMALGEIDSAGGEAKRSRDIAKTEKNQYQKIIFTLVVLGIGDHKSSNACCSKKVD